MVQSCLCSHNIPPSVYFIWEIFAIFIKQCHALQKCFSTEEDEDEATEAGGLVNKLNIENILIVKTLNFLA